MIVKMEEVGGQTLDRAEKLLAGIPDGINKAVRSAMTRATSALRSNTAKRIRERYAISKENLRIEQNVSTRYSYRAGGGVEASVVFRGNKIPLYRFDGASPKQPTTSNDTVVALIQGNWRMTHPGVAASGHQLKSTSPETFSSAFVARMQSGHVGIFERTGGMTASGSSEIQELMGSSIPQMLGNSEVADKLTRDAAAKFEERLDHEVQALLNGWR